MKNLWNVHKPYFIHCLYIWWLVLVNTIMGLSFRKAVEFLALLRSWWPVKTLLYSSPLGEGGINSSGILHH